MSESEAVRAATAREILGAEAKSTVPQQWLKYHHRLMRLRERLVQERAELREQAATELPVEQLHPADAASDEFDHDLAWSLLSAEQNSLYEVEEALRRMRDGTFGTCEATGQPIPRRRLDVIPWTRFTVEAQTRLEKEHAVALPHVQQAQSISGENRIPSAESPGQIEVAARRHERTRADIARELQAQIPGEEPGESGRSIGPEAERT